MIHELSQLIHGFKSLHKWAHLIFVLLLLLWRGVKCTSSVQLKISKCVTLVEKTLM